jgi:hypothetical protein
MRLKWHPAPQLPPLYPRVDCERKRWKVITNQVFSQETEAMTEKSEMMN